MFIKFQPGKFNCFFFMVFKMRKKWSKERIMRDDQAIWGDKICSVICVIVWKTFDVSTAKSKWENKCFFWSSFIVAPVMWKCVINRLKKIVYVGMKWKFWNLYLAKVHLPWICDDEHGSSTQLVIITTFIMLPI